jgi:transposase
MARNRVSPPKKTTKRTAQRLFECLQEDGYRGAYDSVQRYVKDLKLEQKMTPAVTKAFIPLAFPPGESCQFDWSEEFVELGRIGRKIKVGHFCLSYSRKMFVVAYPCETQEMVLDAPIKPFPSLVACLCEGSRQLLLRCSTSCIHAVV